jgi:stage V sporulation protein G
VHRGMSPFVFRVLENSFVETIQPDGFARKKARKGVDIMTITEVRVFPVSEERLKGYATIIFDDCFIVRDLKIIHGNTGLFVAMPSKKRKDGTFKDTAHPLNNSTRQMIEERVLDEYRKELDRLRDSPTGTEI